MGKQLNKEELEAKAAKKTAAKQAATEAKAAYDKLAKEYDNDNLSAGSKKDLAPALATAKKLAAKTKATFFELMTDIEKKISLEADLKAMKATAETKKAAALESISKMNTSIKNKKREIKDIDSAMNAIKGQIFDLM
jgi:hypothetical protein